MANQRTIPASAITSANNIETNYRTSLVALRAKEVAPYFTVGSKAYFGDQVFGKDRNGQSYAFIIRDRGEVENTIAASAGAKKTVIERAVNLSIEPWHVFEKINVVENTSDVEYDREVAEPNGQALIQGALKKAIQSDVPKSSTCFVGDAGEFEPLAMASAHLSSITSEPIYGFCDSMVQALCTSKGAQFVPVDAPAMYKSGLIGIFHGAEYRAQRFIPRVVVSDVLANAMTGAKFGGYNEGTNELTVTFGAAAAGATVIKAGTPFFVSDVVATDTVGDETTEPYAFIAVEDVAVASGAANAVIKVDEVPVSVLGTRVAALSNGDIIKWSGNDANVTATNDVSCPAAGTYVGAILRANGAYEFETLDQIEVQGTDYKKGVVDQVTIHQNRRTDMDTFVNDIRFDLFTLSGTVEKRAQSLVLLKMK